MAYVTVSAKIPRKLKELLDRYDIKPSPVIRKALEEEVKHHILAEVKEKARELSRRLTHISDDEIARTGRGVDHLPLRDASYICAAIKNTLILVTDDRKLGEKAAKHVKVVTTEELTATNT